MIDAALGTKKQSVSYKAIEESCVRAKVLLTFIGEHYTRLGKLPLMMVTSNPQFIYSKIPGWVIIRIGHNSRHTMKQLKNASSRDRITISMRYKPPRKSGQNMSTLPPHPE
jgi:hypothetical protein